MFKRIKNLVYQHKNKKIWIHNISKTEFHTPPVSFNPEDSDSTEIFPVNDVIAFRKSEINQHIKNAITTGKLKIIPEKEALQIKEINKQVKIVTDLYILSRKSRNVVREGTKQIKSLNYNSIREKLKRVDFSDFHTMLARAKTYDQMQQNKGNKLDYPLQQNIDDSIIMEDIYAPEEA